MNRIALFGLAALLMTGSMAGAQPAGTDEIAVTIFAMETPGCADVVGTPASDFVQTDFICGLCSVPSCQGASPTSYCGLAPSGERKYCQATTLCTGEGIRVRRCMCVVGGDIIP